MEDLGKLIALTANHEVNSLAALHFADEFGKQEIYQLAHEEEDGELGIPGPLRGRVLFDAALSYEALTRRFRQGQTLKITPLTDKFSYEQFQEMYGGTAVPLFLLEEGRLLVRAAGDPFRPRPGQSVVALVEEPVEAMAG